MNYVLVLFVLFITVQSSFSQTHSDSFYNTIFDCDVSVMEKRNPYSGVKAKSATGRIMFVEELNQQTARRTYHLGFEQNVIALINSNFQKNHRATINGVSLVVAQLQTHDDFLDIYRSKAPTVELEIKENNLKTVRTLRLGSGLEAMINCF